jgi:formylglycine-generating enzyme required for sulfatase activity
MRYCSNCGKQLPDKAKFCTYCGQRREEQVEPGSPKAPGAVPEMPEVVREFGSDEVADTAYKLLEPGEACCGYRIVRLLNKDPEGIKYIAEKDGKQYVLKLFFKYKYSDLESFIAMQNRLALMSKLKTSHTAKVVEVNQTHDPAYMASEYVNGMSLARVKANDPGRLTEQFIRGIGRQLVLAAMAVRSQGLTLKTLTPSGIMIPETGDNITILSSGIRYEEVDEREEVFNIGVILAQLLSGNVLHTAVYSYEYLSEHKFNYIPGITLSLNKVLSDSLHRNILQRYNSLESLLKGLNSLPPVDQDEVFSSPGGPPVIADIQNELIQKPRSVEWPFLLLIVGVVAALVAFFIWGLPAIMKPGGIGEDIAAYFAGESDSLDVAVQDEPRPGAQSAKQAAETGPVQTREDPRLKSLSSDLTYTPAKPAAKPVAPPPDRSRFVRIPDGTFGFGRLKENPNHNVSQDGFYISKYEVTQKEWNAFMKPSNVSFVGDNLPVDNVSWDNIVRYCNARSEQEGLQPAYRITGSSASSVTCDFSANGYRLPTEAEWEMAAKAGSLFEYSGSDDPDGVAWYRDNSSRRYRSVGQKEANDFGVYDMSGNVAEWCWDWYDSKYTTLLSEFINPRGPAGGTVKVIRGGSVNNGIGTNLGILYRSRGNPGQAYQFVGFRLVRTR